MIEKVKLVLSNNNEPTGDDLFDKIKGKGCKVKTQPCGCGCNGKKNNMKEVEVYPTGGPRPYRITGTVIDAKTKEPMPLTNISIPELNKGTMTDDKGYFDTTTRNGDDMVSVSFVGYKTQTFPASKTPATIELQEESEILNEVVVIAKKAEKAVKDNAWLVALGLVGLFAYAKTKGTKKRSTAPKKPANGKS